MAGSANSPVGRSRSISHQRWKTFHKHFVSFQELRLMLQCCRHSYSALNTWLGKRTKSRYLSTNEIPHNGHFFILNNLLKPWQLHVKKYFFYRTQVWSLSTLVSNWLTYWLLFSRLDWHVSGLQRCCWCRWCWCWGRLTTVWSRFWSWGLVEILSLDFGHNREAVWSRFLSIPMVKILRLKFDRQFWSWILVKRLKLNFG